MPVTDCIACCVVAMFTLLPCILFLLHEICTELEPADRRYPNQKAEPYYPTKTMTAALTKDE